LLASTRDEFDDAIARAEHATEILPPWPGADALSDTC
jgi:hypothetical protein